MTEAVDSPNLPDLEQLITTENVLKSIERNEKWWPQLKDVMSSDKDGVYNFVNRAVAVYKSLEHLADNPLTQLPRTPEEAQKIRALWIQSAPGTYFEARKNDRYANKPWAAWMDRRRFQYGVKVACKIAETIAGVPLPDDWLKAREIIREHGPVIICNGTNQENSVYRIALSDPINRMPKDSRYVIDNAYIINSNNDNTIDQVKKFRLPPYLPVKKGEVLGLIIHAPQGLRLLHMIAQLGTIPQDLTLKMFTLPTPKGGMPEYPIQEIRGTVYYRFIANPPAAAAFAYPHVL